MGRRKKKKAEEKPMVLKRPYKRKKPIDPFVSEELNEEVSTPAVTESVRCECGQPVHPGTHQCWACSHRS